MNRRSVHMFTTPCIESKHVSSSSYGDASDIYDKEEFADFKFCFKDESKDESPIQYLYAHKAILSTRSSVFRCNDGWKDQSEVFIDYCSYEAFAAYLFFIYSGQIEVSSLNLYQTVELYDLGEEYMEPKVKSKAKQHLSAKLNSERSFDEIMICYQRANGHQDIQQMLVENVISLNNCIQVAEFGFDYNYDTMLKAAAKFILENKKLFSDRFDLQDLDSDLAKALLTSLLDS